MNDTELYNNLNATVANVRRTDRPTAADRQRRPRLHRQNCAPPRRNRSRRGQTRPRHQVRDASELRHLRQRTPARLPCRCSLPAGKPFPARGRSGTGRRNQTPLAIDNNRGGDLSSRPRPRESLPSAVLSDSGMTLDAPGSYPPSEKALLGTDVSGAPIAERGDGHEGVRQEFLREELVFDERLAGQVQDARRADFEAGDVDWNLASLRIRQLSRGGAAIRAASFPSFSALPNSPPFGFRHPHEAAT